MLKKLKLRLRALFQKKKMEFELDEELQFHMEKEIEQNIQRGMSLEEAHWAALRNFGGVERVKEETRDVRGIRFVEEVWQDLRYGLRMLFKHKGFTTVAVLSLALGIGANTGLFTVVDAVLLKTLPVAEPESLVLFEYQAGLSFRTSGMSGTSYVPAPPGKEGDSLFRHEVFKKMHQTQSVNPDSPLSDFFAFAPIEELTAVVGDQAKIINGQAVSGSYYAGLSVQPIFGRAIRGEDERSGATPVVVLSHQFWQEHFGSNPTVIGKQLKLNKQSFIIIGVTPPEFTGTSQVGFHPAITIPLACEPLLRGENSRLGTAKKPGYWWLNLMGRLKPGATYEQARESLNGAFQATALEIMPPPRKANQPAKLEPKDYPHLLATSGSHGMLDMRRFYSPTIYGLFIVVALVLLIACANVANLLLARAAMRGPEISVRLGVGAGRWRLVRQLLTESALLAVLGGAVGVLFAFCGKNALVALTDKDTKLLPNNVDLNLNWRALAFTLAVSLLTSLLFGVAPAWRATTPDIATNLKQGRRMTGVASRLSKGLIITQVAISLLLLIGTGLFIRTLYNLQQVNLGFNQDNLLLLRLQPQQVGYENERLLQFYQQLFAKLDHLPGIRAATFGRVPLIADENSTNSFLLPGEIEKTASRHITKRQTTRENYFATLEIPLLRGREFTDQDDQHAPPIAIVNQTFARKFFPNNDAIGKHITIPSNDKNEIEIVGIVSDTKYRNQRDNIEPILYTPWQQESELIGGMYFALRTTNEPTTLVTTVRRVVRELDSNIPVTEITTQRARSHATLGRERLSARLLGFFGGLAILLAAIGMSGVLAYSVAQRTNEIGIRRALGAEARNILQLVIWQGMKLVLIGLVAGTASGYALKRLVESKYVNLEDWLRQFGNQLYGVSVSDPWTFIAIATLLMLVALAACYAPARRATKVDPIIVLRSE